MGSFTDYLEDKLVSLVFGAAAFSAPANLFIGLSSSSITDSGGNITEPVGNGYARKSVTNNATNFPLSSGGAGSNGTQISFNTATGSWGTVVDFFIADASSGGNVLAYGTLGTPKAIGNGDTASFAAGALTYSLA